MIEKEFLLRIARNKGLKNREHIEKDYFQDLLLYHLYKKSNNFVFKGGTCLYKLYNLPRFSEDLDFSVLSQENIEETIANIAKELNVNFESKKNKNFPSFQVEISRHINQI